MLIGAFHISLNQGEHMKKVLLGVVLITSLTGCVTAPVINTAASPDEKGPGPGEGVVVLSVTGNTSQVNQFDEVRVIRFEPKSDKPAPANAPPQRAQAYVLRQSSRGLARDTAVFAGVLPAGEYYFDRFTDLDTQRFLALNEVMRNQLGHFTVSTNTLSDLGRLVLTPANFKVTVGRSTLVQTNAPLIRRFLPELAKSYDRKVIAGWTEPKKVTDLSEASAVAFPVGATALTELANGEVAAATRMGTVLLRDKNGRWRKSASGKLESLLWVTPYDDGDSRLLAVGEFNTLLRMDTADRLHAIDTADLPAGNLIFIDGNAKVGFFVAQARGDDVFIYRSPTLTNPKWEQIGNEKTGRSFWSGQQHFWAWPTSKGFAYAVTKGDIRVYDFAQGGWTNRKAPNDRSLVKVETSPGDVWGILTSPGGGFAGIFAKTHYSRDFGATWIDTNSPYSVKVSTPKITPRGTLLEVGGVFGDAGIQASTDGKTWKKVTEKKALADSLWVLPTAGLFLVSDGSLGIETIEHSVDDGVSWKVERTTFSRALYEAEKQKKNP